MSGVKEPSNTTRIQVAATEPSALQRAIAALEKMKARLDAVERAANEPIAVVGMGCRFPGGGEGPEAFWHVLSNGIDAVREIPASRWPANEIPGERPAARWAALLDDLSGFDAAFFGISPREAESLDPQQRMLLEVTWEALEDAGLSLDRLFGSRTGVFVGICSNDYQLVVGESRAGQYDAYCATGNMASTAAGRVSFALGFHGPAMSIDTACSSSLVAIAQASQCLRTGDCDVAVAGGVNALLSSRTMALLLETQALSPDGRCKTLDSLANGFVRGEGCGVLILKRLSDAIRDCDRISGVIRGWAVNQDGRSTGLTTPNVLMQQSMLREALERARLSPSDIGYIEMHGTGTSLGDPIEAEALREVLGAPRTDGSSCVLGAVKTNIGHLEGAAGIAGVIKSLLALEHDLIPRNLHFRKLNPRISLENTSFVIPKEHIPWPRGTKPRRVGVSAFGLSGTNAHIILEERPQRDAAVSNHNATAYLLPLSAKSLPALKALAQSYAKWLPVRTNVSMHDIVYTASVRRTHHEYRLAVSAGTREEFAQLFEAFARGEARAGFSHGQTTTQGAPPIVFVFSGQGSQWAGMGKTLLDEEPIFRAKIEEIDALAGRHANFSLVKELLAAEQQSRLVDTEIAQPALFALQVGLAELFKFWGIVPNAVIGHSVGEVAAAHVSGAISLEDAVRLVVLRGRIMQKATGNGKMAWVALSAEDATRFVSRHLDKLSIAAVNDPSSVVLSGDTVVLEALLEELSAQGVASRALRVNYAFHSPQMDPLASIFVEDLDRLDAKSANVAMYSTVTGKRIDGAELGIAYWGKNIRVTVNLAAAIEAALRDDHCILMEVGPHPVLAANLAQCVSSSKRDVRVVPTLRRQCNGRRDMLEAIGTLHVYGFPIKWGHSFPNGGRAVSLPHSPWQKEHFWVAPPQRHRIATDEGAHPLLGTRFDSSITPGEHAWQQWLSLAQFPYLSGHRVGDRVVFPGAGYAEIALAATSTICGSGVVAVDEMSLDHMLALDADEERQIQTVLQQHDDGHVGIAIASRGQQELDWTPHVAVRAHIESASPPRESENIQAIISRCKSAVESSTHYERMNKRRLFYSMAFRGVRHVHYGDNVAVGHILLPELPEVNVSTYFAHPALLDACLQTANWVLESHSWHGALIPKAFLGLRYHGRPSRHVWVVVRFLGSTEDGDLAVNIVICNDAGKVYIEIVEMRLACVVADVQPLADPFDDWLFRIAWRKTAAPAKPYATRAEDGAWLVLANPQEGGHSLASRLRQDGHACVEVVADSTYGPSPSGNYRLDPTNPQHIRRLLTDAFDSRRACRGIIHSLSLGAVPWQATTSNTLLADLRRGCLSALHLAQSMVTQGWRDIPRLYLITRGVHFVDPKDDSVAVTQAPLWGLGQTITLEHPALECTRIDLSPALFPEEIDMLAHEILSNDAEDQIALRRSGRYAARLIRSTITEAPERDFALRPDRTYLITGGLGGLGLELAKWMVAEGARHLVLIGRNEPTPQAAAVLLDLDRAGAKVRVGRADVSQYQAMLEMLTMLRREMPPMAGVVHAAASLDDRTLLELSEESFFRVMRAKVFGAFQLEKLMDGEKLDFFVLYSSAAALLGSPGQANYSAANAFLDAVARARVLAGKPGMSIAWGPFSDVGLAAARDNRGKRLAARGMEGFSPAIGNAFLMKLLRHPRGEVAAIRLSVAQWLEVFPQSANSPFFGELGTDTRTSTNVAQSFRESIEAAAPARRVSLIQMHVLERLGRVLHISPTQIHPSATFASLGVDSLMSLELRNSLQSSLGLDLQATLLFAYPTTEKLVAHIVDKLELGGHPPQPTVSPAGSNQNEKSAQTAAVSDLGIDDLMAMLDEELLAAKKGGQR